MEPRFGVDFGDVRIHTGAEAAQSARSLGARAYTAGSHIVLGEGEFAPHGAPGRELLAHELAHVVQQRERPDAPAIQRRVVNTDYYLPCRSVPGRDAKTLEAAENAGATLGDDAAKALRARPLSETTRKALWETFRLDYNDPIVRCRHVPEIADRMAEVAHAMRTQFVRYNCSTTADDTWRCGLGNYMAVTFLDQIDLCQSFWNLPSEQAETLFHEWVHYENLLTVWDPMTGGMSTAGCYQNLAALLSTGAMSSPDTACPLSTDPLPPLDKAKIAEECPRNVLLEPSLTVGGYWGSSTGRSGLLLGAGLDLALPLTPLHRYDFNLGARFTFLKDVAPDDQNAYYLGMRAGVSARWRPWSGAHFGVGGFAEGGAAWLPGTAFDPAGGDQSVGAHPYYGVGARATLDLRIDKQQVFDIFAEVSKTTSIDTTNDKTFDAFLAGFGASYRF
jgi:Domain of unknown function (DUF4157)